MMVYVYIIYRLVLFRYLSCALKYVVRLSSFVVRRD